MLHHVYKLYHNYGTHISIMVLCFFFWMIASIVNVLQLLETGVMYSRTTQEEHLLDSTDNAHSYNPNPLAVTTSRKPECNYRGELLGIPPSLKNCTDCQHLQCHRFLFPEPRTEMFDIGRHWMLTHPLKERSNDEIRLKAQENCTKFLHDEGFHLQPLSTEEAEFPLAFNIIMHKHGPQFLQLLRTIYQPQHSICVHVDLNAPDDLWNMVASVVGCLDAAFLVSKRENVVYAGYSRLQADINCMLDQETGQGAHVPWKYLINTCGQGFPLKSNLEIVQILKMFNGMNDIEITYDELFQFRFEYVWVEESSDGVRGMHNTEKPHVPPPHGLTIMKGSAYGTFSRAFVKFVLTDDMVHDFLEWSKHTFSPDEHVWATLQYIGGNPQLKTPGGSVVYIEGDEFLTVWVSWIHNHPCWGRVVRWICVLGLQDLPTLLDHDNRHQFMVNKFAKQVQPLALDCMEMYIHYREQCPAPLDVQYYRNVLRKRSDGIV